MARLKATEIRLSEEEENALTKVVNRHKESQQIVKRADCIGSS